MANHARDNDELRRSAAQSAALLNARNAARRDARGADGYGYEPNPRQRRASQQPQQRRGGGQQQPQRGGGQQQETAAEFVKRNSVYVISVAGVVIIVLLMLLFIRACGPSKTVAEVETEEGYVSPYDWSKLDRTNDRYAYVVNGQTRSRLGIDVSENNHWIDWNAVKNDGIDFVMIRLGYRGATEGDLYLDDSFEANLEGAKAAGVDCGVYFFSQATSVDEAVEEANYVLEHLNGTKLEYPIAFDSEEVAVGEQGPRTSGLSNDEMTVIAEAFCNRVEQAGYSAMVYGNRYDMARYSYEHMEKRNLWWAEYDVSEPSAQIDVIMWQYSNGGEVAGIETYVDMNIDLSNVL